mmetsp:Transcript_8085/g.19872  ORF Transcript_8085/g.19872 Transcript_8085/m.19872 type:complete len:83 (+) Transcript_8085:621-869(+)
MLPVDKECDRRRCKSSIDLVERKTHPAYIGKHSPVARLNARISNGHDFVFTGLQCNGNTNKTNVDKTWRVSNPKEADNSLTS